MLKPIFKQFATYIANTIGADRQKDERHLLALGAVLTRQQYSIPSTNINDHEFKVFSQFGDDGIIQYLINNLQIPNKTFIEFGVSDYLESNTRFLMMNNNWSGLVLDGSESAIESIKNQSWFWKYDLKAEQAFIDTANINGLLDVPGFENVGLLHVDLDGNDYHILASLDLKKLNPAILIAEYNSVFGKERAIAIPYDPVFVRSDVHYSHLYWGASLPAFNYLLSQKGYTLVGCNLAGNNAYFVKSELLNDKIVGVSVETGFTESKFRESRDRSGALSLITGDNRLKLIAGMPVINVQTQQREEL